MTVYIVFEEWESGGDGHAALVSAHADLASAEAAATTHRQHLADQGFAVWCFPTDEDQPEDWQVDVHVDSLNVQS